MAEDDPGVPRLTVSVYRGNASSLPDIPEAWVAHRERAKVLAEVVSESTVFRVVDEGSFNDQARAHEFARQFWRSLSIRPHKSRLAPWREAGCLWIQQRPGTALGDHCFPGLRGRRRQ
jgi:hypothetical protein